MLRRKEQLLLGSWGNPLVLLLHLFELGRWGRFHWDLRERSEDCEVRGWGVLSFVWV